VQELDAFPYLTEQDKQIAAYIRRASDSYYGGSEFEINIDKALPFLVAHPAVYWSMRRMFALMSLKAISRCN
jgi:hypothetical protein